jgi:pyruvate/2-oxoglutarate dehydrogenase complex dihydrolipoamide acyltransferase (E2) component
LGGRKMAETIGMPKLGLTMETGAVGTWLVSEGDEVKAGQVIAEIVTEKITYELECETAGVVLKVLLDEEVEVPVGTPLIVIGQPGEESA